MGKRTETQLEKLKLGQQGWNEVLSANMEKLNDILLKIDGLLDVDISGLATGDVLWWNETNQKFENVNKAYAISAGSVSSWSSESSISSTSSESSESSESSVSSSSQESVSSSLSVSSESSESSETISSDSSDSSESSESSDSSTTSESSESSESFESSSSSSSQSETGFTKMIAANGDDGYHDGGTLYSTATTVYIGDYTTTNNYAWIRFTNVTIPKNAIIISAKIRFQAASSLSVSTVRTNIYIEDADNPNAPSSVADYNGRLVGSPVTWDFTTSWTADSDYDTVDFSSILETHLSRSGWSSGNAIQIFIKDDSSSDNAHRRAKAYDNYPSNAAQLIVQYIEGSSSSSSSESSETISSSSSSQSESSSSSSSSWSCFLEGDDDFTGTNGDPPNPHLWINNGAEIQSNELAMSASGSIESAISRFVLDGSGNYDIQIDYNASSAPSTASWGMRFFVTATQAEIDDSDDWFVIQRTYIGPVDGHEYRCNKQESGVSGTVQTVSSSGTNSKMRITKTGTNYKSYYWDTSWVEVGDFTISALGDVYVGIEIKSWNTNPSIACEWDNFTITSGDYECADSLSSSSSSSSESSESL